MGVPGPVCVNSSLISVFNIMAERLYHSTRSQLRVEPGIDAACVELEDLPAIALGQVEGIEVALRVVPVEAGLRVDPADGTQHLGREEDVLDVDHVAQERDTGVVVHTRVEEDVA